MTSQFHKAVVARRRCVIRSSDVDAARNSIRRSANELVVSALTHSVSQSVEKMKAICEVNTAQQNSHARLLTALLDASLFSGQTIDIRSDWRHEVEVDVEIEQHSRHCSRSRLARSSYSCCVVAAAAASCCCCC